MAQIRRLAAIMFTDIVGYTALMGSNEKKAFELLRKNRNIQKPIISKYRGKWLKEMGDGILASFDTASDAVRCAGEIQQKGGEEGIGLRIGIHLGEVVFEGGDVLGDGVNVASRLEEIAEAGSIYVSGAIYKNVKNKEGITTEFLGDKTFKNVDEPVNVYKVQYEKMDEIQEVFTKKISKKGSYYSIGGILVLIVAMVLIWFFYSQKKAVIEEDKLGKSIAVLPFRNESPDQENEYFCNGTVEAILTNIQKIKDLRVKSRTSVEQYRNPGKDLIDIANELKVAFILEGSVQKVGNNIRITAQLINGRTGDHIWAEDYDGKYTEEILSFQSNVAKRIASSLQTVITPKEEEQIDYNSTVNMEAYDLQMRGNEMIRKFEFTKDTTYANIAMNLFNQALELDPENGLTFKDIGRIYLLRGNYDSAAHYFEKTIELLPDHSGGYQGKGRIFWLTNQPDSAYHYLQKGYKLNPNDQWTNLILGQYYKYMVNDVIQALPYYQKAYELGGAEWAEININVGQLFWDIGEYAKAEKYFKQALNLRQECSFINNTNLLFISEEKYDRARQFLDSICSITKCERNCAMNKFFILIMHREFDEAELYYEYYLSTGGTPDIVMNLWAAYMFKETGREQKFSMILSSLHNSIEQGLSTNRNGYWLVIGSLYYAIQNDHELSLRHLKEAVDKGLSYGLHDFLPIFPLYEGLWDDPLFKTLVKHAQDEKAAIRAQVHEMIESGEIDL